MLVKTLLKDNKKDLITARPDMSIDEAMNLLITKNIGCLPIIDGEDQLVGIISDKDIFRRIHETGGQYHDLKISDVMTTALILGFLDDDLTYIAGIMDKNWIRHVPIVDGDALIGLVSQRDIIRAQAENREIENRYLKLYTEGIHLRDKSADF